MKAEAEGIAVGVERGRAEGIAEGVEKGKAAGVDATLAAMREAMRDAGVDDETRRRIEDDIARRNGK